jgi:hypothetical protein
MRTWLSSLVNAILGRIPGKISRLDTATRMAVDADFSDRHPSMPRALPRERDDGHLIKPIGPSADRALFEQLVRIVNEAQERDAEDERRLYDPMPGAWPSLSQRGRLDPGSRFYATPDEDPSCGAFDYLLRSARRAKRSLMLVTIIGALPIFSAPAAVYSKPLYELRQMAEYDRQRTEEDRGLPRAWPFLVLLFWMLLTGVMLWNAPFLPWIGILKLAGLMIGLAALCGAASVLMR